MSAVVFSEEVLFCVGEVLLVSFDAVEFDDGVLGEDEVALVVVPLDEAEPVPVTLVAEPDPPDEVVLVDAVPPVLVVLAVEEALLPVGGDVVPVVLPAPVLFDGGGTTTASAGGTKVTERPFRGFTARLLPLPEAKAVLPTYSDEMALT